MTVVPGPFTLHTTAGHLEQAIGTVPCDYLLENASLASNLLAILAIKELF